MAVNGTDTQQHKSEDENAVSFVEKGGTLTKFGSNGKKYRRYFFVDPKTMTLCYSGSKKRCNGSDGVQIFVPIKHAQEVVAVDNNENEKRQSMFTIGAGNETGTKTLMAPSAAARDLWVSGLRQLAVDVEKVNDDPVRQERIWIERCFAVADANRDGLLDEDETVHLVNSLNFSAADSERVRQELRTQKTLNVDQFIALYDKLGKNKELEMLFNRCYTTIIL